MNHVEIAGECLAKADGVKVAIATSASGDTFVEEDVWLRDEFRRRGHCAQIVIWGNEHFRERQFDALVVRSVWGYQDQFMRFSEWIRETSMSICVLNPVNVLLWNMDKTRQIDFCKDHGIQHIPSVHIAPIPGEVACLDDALSILRTSSGGTMFVVKPAISASGRNTFVFDVDDRNLGRPNQISYERAAAFCSSWISNAGNSGLLVQRFCSSIDSGELSFVFIGDQISHVVRRRPSVFTVRADMSRAEEISLDRLPGQDLDQALAIIRSLDSYCGSLFGEATRPVYGRLDCVQIDGELVVMEVELIDPDLYFRKILDRARRCDAIGRFVGCCIRQMR